VSMPEVVPITCRCFDPDARSIKLHVHEPQRKIKGRALARPS
jgi:hypothetical protein